MRALIEQIEAGHREIRLPFGIVLKETPDILDIANKRSAWIFSLFTGYKQYGQFAVNRPHNFKEGQLVEIEMDNQVITKVTELCLEVA